MDKNKWYAEALFQKIISRLQVNLVQKSWSREINVFGLGLDLESGNNNPPQIHNIKTKWKKETKYNFKEDRPTVNNTELGRHE